MLQLGDKRTENDHSGCGTASLGHDVAGQAGVVARVGEPRLVDDEVVVSTGVDVVVSQGAQHLLVFEPLHLHMRDEENRDVMLHQREIISYLF